MRGAKIVRLITFCEDFRVLEWDSQLDHIRKMAARASQVQDIASSSTVFIARAKAREQPLNTPAFDSLLETFEFKNTSALPFTSARARESTKVLTFGPNGWLSQSKINEVFKVEEKKARKTSPTANPSVPPPPRGNVPATAAKAVPKRMRKEDAVKDAASKLAEVEKLVKAGKVPMKVYEQLKSMHGKGSKGGGKQLLPPPGKRESLHSSSSRHTSAAAGTTYRRREIGNSTTTRCTTTAATTGSWSRESGTPPPPGAPPPPPPALGAENSGIPPPGAPPPPPPALGAENSGTPPPPGAPATRRHHRLPEQKKSELRHHQVHHRRHHRL